jgi:chemotaxis protein histidine kinase CheA
LEETDEVIQEFLVECHEGLDRLDQEFVQLEQEPGSTALLASIFRTIHTIKGTCGFLGFHNLQGVTHAGETLLARLRDGQIPLTQERVDALLMVVDVVRYMLSQVESTGTDGEEPHSDLVEALLALTAGEPDPPEAPSDPVLQEAEAQAPIPPDPGPSQLIPQDRALLEPVRQDPVRQDPIRQERSERSFEAPHHAVSLVEQSVRVDVRASTTWRVYADGRPDELVRGIDLVGTPLVAFDNLIAAGDDPMVFNGTCGAESGWVPVSAVAPSILFRRLEFQLKEKGQDRPPLLAKPGLPEDGSSMTEEAP